MISEGCAGGYGAGRDRKSSARCQEELVGRLAADPAVGVTPAHLADLEWRGMANGAVSPRFARVLVPTPLKCQPATTSHSVSVNQMKHDDARRVGSRFLVVNHPRNAVSGTTFIQDRTTAEPTRRCEGPLL